MTTIAILLEKVGENGITYRAVAGKMHSRGRTAGEALDALATQLSEDKDTMLVIVQSAKEDRFFTDTQQERLSQLMERWREARDAGHSLPPDQQADLESLIEAELEAAKKRAELALSQLTK